jgi:hypothetical protein
MEQPAPALLTTTSIFPKAAIACSVAICTRWTSVTSSLKILMLSYAVSSLSFSGVRMVAATFQPHFAKWSAVNLPRLLLVPVMNIVLVMSCPFHGCDFRESQRACQAADPGGEVSSRKRALVQFHNAAMHRSGRLALHGKSSSLPVVRRDSISMCACAASANG